MPRILLLGGTSEASALARLLAAQGVEAVYSYAGRTAAPIAQPLPVRIGGFGGAGGLADYLRTHAITHLIDATHPFAATISRNAIAAAHATGPLEMPAPVLAASIPHARLAVRPASEARPAIEAMLSLMAETDPAIIGGKLPDDGFYLL